jgi:large subunit ribosomal protein L25
MTTLTAKSRTDLRRSVLQELRQEKKVPAVVYGKKTKNTPLYVEENELIQLLRKEGQNAIIQLKWNKGNAQVMVADIQYEPIKRGIVHIDFKEVDMNQMMLAEIPIEWVNEDKADRQGVLQKQQRSIEVRCLPADIPDKISVDLAGLSIGDSITIKDLGLEGIEIEAGEETVLVTLLAPALEEETEAASEEEAAEPARVGEVSEEN